MDFIASGLKMLGVLILIVGVLAVFNVYSRRLMHRGSAGRRGKRIQVLESTLLGMKKSIALVRVPGSVLVLGVTGERITLIDKIPESEYRAEATVPSVTPEPSFQDHLGRLLNRFGGRLSSEDEDRPGQPAGKPAP
ncbi:MAG: FliO/MopB family protein [Desulfobacterales bacterium]